MSRIVRYNHKGEEIDSTAWDGIEAIAEPDESPDDRGKNMDKTFEPLTAISVEDLITLNEIKKERDQFESVLNSIQKILLERGEPTVYGRWIPFKDILICSNCGLPIKAEVVNSDFKFCPGCGIRIPKSGPKEVTNE